MASDLNAYPDAAWWRNLSAFEHRTIQQHILRLEPYYSCCTLFGGFEYQRLRGDGRGGWGGGRQQGKVMATYTKVRATLCIRGIAFTFDMPWLEELPESFSESQLQPLVDAAGAYYVLVAPQDAAPSAPRNPTLVFGNPGV